MNIGFVFPGQGSQSIGMLGDLAQDQPAIQETFAEAGEVLGLPLWDLACSGPEERLNQTEITQPILLTASVAIWRAWQSHNAVQPAVVAGHSLGEYSALVCANALDFAAALALVHARGKFMQQAVPQGEGAMAAILGLDDNQVEVCCNKVDGIVSAANFNAPGQVVIAGSAAAVDAAVEQCSAAGARRAVLLRVSGPFHCELMEPAKQDFAQLLDDVELRMPDIPVVHNVDAKIALDVDELRSKLLQQMAAPVRWSSCVELMIELGAEQFVECGPGKVLAGLIKRIDRSKTVSNIDSSKPFSEAIDRLQA